MLGCHFYSSDSYCYGGGFYSVNADSHGGVYVWEKDGFGCGIQDWSNTHGYAANCYLWND